jgi:hypothetical protein
MKPISTILIVLIVIAGIFFFTKPSNQQCIKSALELVKADNYHVPGYGDPGDAENKNPGQVSSQNVMITDKFLWKKVSYVHLDEVRTVGYGYLGSFHKVKSKS